MHSILESGNEQQRRVRQHSSIPAGVPCVWFVATCYFSPVAIRNRRSGFIGILVGESPPRDRPEMVAGAAARSDRLRRFAISTDVVICWERDVNQSCEPGLRRVTFGERL